ncbi:MAG: CinA family protein [Treponema sp.]|jgi:PncC family amidohydrolase|nr:CinA family protein [Treponema sp.]
MDDAGGREESAAGELVRRLEKLGKTAAAAESCTAGLAADLIARIPGASRVFWGSFVTYSVDAKIRMLGLEEALIRNFGAVSRETALAMAGGALEKSGADYALSVTGLAGPGGDGSGLPVGTVWIATAAAGGEARSSVFRFSGSRNEVRSAAAQQAIAELLSRLP